MKKLLSLAIVVLLGFNIYLSWQVMQLQQTIENVSGEQVQIIENKYISFVDDVTDVVDHAVNKVVGVSSYFNNRLLGTGSGAIIEVSNNQVHIVTNHHVIEGANSIKVAFANGREFDATLIGSDVFSDLALLSASPDFSVNAFKLGDSSRSRVGEWVLAIGSPLGLDFQSSVTMGILSGKDRTIAVDISGNGVADWDMNVLQTDAAINPGNSGGPLINLNGEIIGINSMKIVMQQVEGMGFSIPINEAIPIIEQLKEFGEVIRPVLGVMAVAVGEMSLYQKNAYGIDLNQTQGVFITQVMEGSPAEAAGLQENDILMEFDGQVIENFKQFRQLLYSKNVGDTVRIRVRRDNRDLNISVVLE